MTHSCYFSMIFRT